MEKILSPELTEKITHKLMNDVDKRKQLNILVDKILKGDDFDNDIKELEDFLFSIVYK